MEIDENKLMKQVMILIRTEMWLDLKKIADFEGITISYLVKLIIRKYLSAVRRGKARKDLQWKMPLLLEKKLNNSENEPE